MSNSFKMKHRPKDNYFKNSHYEKFIADKACLVCNMTPVQKHHVEHARGNCYMLIPLCESHHMPGYPTSYHQLERERFEDCHSLNLDWEIQKLLMQYIDENK